VLQSVADKQQSQVHISRRLTTVHWYHTQYMSSPQQKLNKNADHIIC